jgi:hypothetical protein
MRNETKVSYRYQISTRSIAMPIKIEYLCYFFLLPIILCVLLVPTQYAQAATIRVNTTDDSPSNPMCSLRNAILAGNTNAAVGACSAGEVGLDTIVLPAGVYFLTIAGQDENNAQTGDLDIRESLMISGTGRETTIIDGSNLDRVLDISTGITVSLNHLTIQHGSLAPHAGQVHPLLAGAGIYNAGFLALTASAVLSNSVPYSETLGSKGGAIFSSGTLSLAETLIQGNQGQQGGAVYARAGRVVITNSKFINNVAEMGGAIYLYENSMTNITHSQILSNIATADHSVGGGIVNAGFLTVTDVLVANNQAFPSAQFANPYSQGGGIANLKQASAFITRTDITHNRVWGDVYPDSQGGGIYNAGTLRVQQSRIAHNSSSGDGGGIYGGGNYRDVAIEHNGAGSRGGGIFGLGDLTNVTISHNVVGEFGKGGGGYGCGTLVNVTISNNHTGNFGRGGGLSFDASDFDFVFIGNCLELSNVTIISNTAVSGSGIALTRTLSGLIVQNTVIAQNAGSKNCDLADSAVQSLGFNYANDLSCELTQPSDRQGSQPDVRLGPLTANGGLTLSNLPQPGSPLIDSGICNGSIHTDQRGEVRPRGYGCDIGAVEASGPILQFLPHIAR